MLSDAFYCLIPFFNLDAAHGPKIGDVGCDPSTTTQLTTSTIKSLTTPSTTSTLIDTKQTITMPSSLSISTAVVATLDSTTALLSSVAPVIFFCVLF
jgi:hypothetical protein